MVEPSTDGERLVAHGPRLRLLLTYLAGPIVRARVGVDDLVQEVYLRVLAGELPADDHELWGLLQTVARHAVIDAVRALRTRKRSGREIPLLHSDWSHAGRRVSQVIADTVGPATRVAEAESMERMRLAFDALDPDHRRVIGLRQFEGRTARDTAARMKRSETAVHSLFRRALMAWEAAARKALPDL